MRRTSSYLLPAAILLSVLFAMLTTAKAQTNNTIYACYDKTNGNLRKVNSPADCRTSEIAVAWNIQGQKGDKGEKGDKGDRGIQGPPGDSGSSLDIFGNGSDGDVEIGSDTTLTRDMYYHNFTIDDGVTLNPGGYRVFVSGTLTLANANIFRDGSSAGGTLCFPEALAPHTLGGAGDWFAPVNHFQILNSLGGSGGFSAAGPPGQFAFPPPTSFADFSHSWLQAVTLRTLDSQTVNGGGAGGPIPGVFDPGCGGGGGGVILIAAHSIVGSGWIRAHGGNGLNGGGGGGGGVVVIVTTTPRPATQQPLALSANGGSRDSGGANGDPGTVLWLVK